MHDLETQQMIATIINHAQTSKSSEFRLLTNYRDYRFHIRKRRSYRLVINALRSGAERLLKSYCDGITTDTADVNKLLAYQQMQQVINFYLREIETFTDMIDEYEARIWKML